MKSHLRENPGATRFQTIHMQLYKTAFVLSLLIFGVGSFTRPAAAAPEKINASYGAISGSMAPIWVAKERQLFQKHGLEISLVYISGGPRSVMALIGGSIQFLNHSAMPSLEAHMRGADTTLIASPMNRLDHSLVVQPNIKSVEDLRGKIVGISTLGSLTDVILREGLRLNGLSDRDVTILPAGDLSARLSGLRTGRIHAAVVAGVQTLAATKLGFKQLIDFSKLPTEISSSSIMARRAYFAKNLDTTLRFLRAWIEGIYLFKSNPEFSLGVLKRYVGTQDSEVLDSIYARYREKLLARPLPSMSVVKSMHYLLTRTNPETREANLESFIETRFIHELESSGFFDQMERQYPAPTRARP